MSEVPLYMYNVPSTMLERVHEAAPHRGHSIVGW